MQNMKGKRYDSTLFDIDSRFFGAFTAALVYHYLLGYFLCIVGVFGKVNFKSVAEKLVHRFVNEAVGYRLFGLVFIGSLC